MNGEVIVVEGVHDKAKILEIYPNAVVIITGGSAISPDVINELKHLSKTHTINLFLDPDHAGNRIRRIISSHIKNVKHSYIKEEECMSASGKKRGVEHASKETIVNALRLSKELVDYTDITWEFLLEHGYTGSYHSREKRARLLNYFNIGYVNAKGLLPKLKLFGITKEEVLQYEQT